MSSLAGDAFHSELESHTVESGERLTEFVVERRSLGLSARIGEPASPRFEVDVELGEERFEPLRLLERRSRLALGRGASGE